MQKAPVAVPAGPAAYARSCAQAGPGYATCFSVHRTDLIGPLDAPGLDIPPGYSPEELQAAYLLPAPTTAGAGQTVAVVDAFDAPYAESDLATYRAKYGLPACTTASGCFRKVNQSGRPHPLPPPDPGWAEEVALDLDMVSAACPNCSILLV